MLGKIIYILPAGGYSGGANSVVQEVSGFLRMGLDASICVDQKNIRTFATAYASLPAITSRLASFASTAELSGVLRTADVAVATVATSVPQVVEAWERLAKTERPKLFYYIQDYEPLFFPRDTPEWHQARRSYEFGLMMRGFAKTNWICDIVRHNHGMSVTRVKASIDHDVYFPLLSAVDQDKLRITAMIRPSTPRRAPRRTARIVNRLAHELGGRAAVTTFGCSTDELREHGLMLDGAVDHLNRLTREQVADVLRRTDLFLDLSDYQAFGRTAIEAMACGSVPVVPVFGGADEFVKHGVNGYFADVRFDEQILESVYAFAKLPSSARTEMRRNALETAADFNIGKACVSILATFMND